MVVEFGSVDEERSRMVRDELSLMSAFLAVADERSFTKAAKRLGVTQSALSHAIRGLEEQVGVRLLARTTRSVAPTDAGEQLIAELRPALTGIRGALDRIGGLRDSPRGRIRLVVSPASAAMVVGPRLAEFAHHYPDVILDVTTTNRMHLDIVAGGFDAGIHLGEFLERDMIAVRVSKDQRAAIVGSPRYFASHAKPESPRDLTDHQCVNFRHGQDELYRWEFDDGSQSLVVGVVGSLIVDELQLMTRAALDGVGLAFMMEEYAAPYLARGELVRVLEKWCQPFTGYFLYYPSRRQQPAALAALVDTLRLREDG
jgi:DNA-binding transcriptional LysR family regulator